MFKLLYTDEGLHFFYNYFISFSNRFTLRYIHYICNRYKEKEVSKYGQNRFSQLSEGKETYFTNNKKSNVSLLTVNSVKEDFLFHTNV